MKINPNCTDTEESRLFNQDLNRWRFFFTNIKDRLSNFDYFLKKWEIWVFKVPNRSKLNNAKTYLFKIDPIHIFQIQIYGAIVYIQLDRFTGRANFCYAF